MRYTRVMLTNDTVIHLPGLISPTRTPWTGTLADALRYDGDTISPNIVALCEAWNVTTQDENEDLLDDEELLAGLDAAGADDTAVAREIFDDPNAEVIPAVAGSKPATTETVLDWLGPLSRETSEEQVDAIISAWNALPSRLTDESEDPDGVREATNGAASYILEGADELDAAKRKWLDTLAAARAAEDYLVGVVVAALDAGQTKASVAEQLGISRPRLDRWLA